MVYLQKRINRLFKQGKKEDILFFLYGKDKNSDELLFSFANKIREEYVGNKIHLRGLLEFSNHCFRECKYCGLNKNINIQRYRMSNEDIINVSKEAINNGYKTIVLQSGEDKKYTIKDYEYIIKNIKSYGEVAITLGIGEQSFEVYKKLRVAGADRYLLKHETSDKKLYNFLNPGMSFKYRIDSLKELKKLGFQTGSGIMIGLPGQTLESIADDILLFKSLNVDMIGCGPFIPHPQTLLANSKIGNSILSYRVMALNRIITKDTHIPLTTALSVATNIKEYDFKKSFYRGANVIMPKLTPSKYRKFYDIYPNNEIYNANSKEYIANINNQLLITGLKVSQKQGHRK